MEGEIHRLSDLPKTMRGARVADVLSGAACGTVGAMAMTGLRVITTELGLVEQTPPQALSRQRPRSACLGAASAAQAASRFYRGRSLGVRGGRRRGIRRAAPRTASPSVDWPDLRIGGVVGL